MISQRLSVAMLAIAAAACSKSNACDTEADHLLRAVQSFEGRQLLLLPQHCLGPQVLR